MYNSQTALERQRASVLNNYSMGVAAVGAVAIGDSIVQAAKLQRTLIAIRNETGANTREMGKFYNTVFQIANTMGVSPSTAGDVMLNISRLTAGTLSTAQMQAIAPMVAGFASTINFNRPDVSVEAATQADIQLSHLFRAYSPEALKPLQDKVYRLSGLMVETPAQAVRQMSYFEPLFKGLKISDNTSIAMMALLDRAGFRQKVGTNVRAMMLQELGPLQMTKHYQEGQGKILKEMGVFDAHGNYAWNIKSGPNKGGVDFLGMLQAVSKWAIAKESAGVPNSVVAKDIYGALGKQGGTIGTLMADPKMLPILAGILDYLKNPNVSLAAGERNRQDSIEFQAGHAWGNFQAIMTELGYRATWVAGSLKTVADDFHNIQAWLHGHRTAEDWIGGLGVGVTALAALGASARVTFGVLRFVGGGLYGIYSVGGKAAGALYSVGSAASAATGPVAGTAGALRGLAGASAAFLASPLGKLFSAGSVFFGTTSFDPSRESLAKLYGKPYADYIAKRHPGDPNTIHSDQGDLLPRAFSAQQTLRKAGKKPGSFNGGGGFGPAKTTIHNQISRVDIHFPNVKDGQEAVAELENFWLNPRSALYTGGIIKTHPNLPAPHTTATDG